MDERILVSVIVPVYNGQQNLRKCLNSLVHQTISSLEVIVVDDGSTDNSWEIIGEYIKEYPGKVYGYKEEHKGQGPARNLGITYAKGEYLAFADCDDQVNLVMYDKMYDIAKEEDSDVVRCGYFEEDILTKKSFLFQTAYGGIFGNSVYDEPDLLYRTCYHIWDKIFRREWFLQTGLRFTENVVFEDMRIVYCLLLKANKISAVLDPMYHFTINAEQALCTDLSCVLDEILPALCDVNESFRKEKRFYSFYNSLLFNNLHYLYDLLTKIQTSGNVEFRKKYVPLIFAHLDKEFPDWNERDYFFDIYYCNSTPRQIKDYRNRNFWLGKKQPASTSGNGQKTGRKIGRGIGRRYALQAYIHGRKKKHIRKNTLLIENYRGNDIFDSSLELVESIAQSGVKVYIAAMDPKRYAKYMEVNHVKAKMVRYGSVQYSRLLASAEFLMNNDCFPNYFAKKKGQCYVQMGHGTPLKAIGRSMQQNESNSFADQNNALQADYMVFPNKMTKDICMKDLGISELFTGKTVISGLPRNDSLINTKKREELRKKYGLEGKKVYAYMPTWRGNNIVGSSTTKFMKDMNTFMTELDKTLYDDQVILYRMYPTVHRELRYVNFGHIQAFPEEETIYDMLTCADALITDYSSVMFDFALTGKPIVLFQYDYIQYEKERGLYSYESELPFTKVQDIEGLCKLFGQRNPKLVASKVDGILAEILANENGLSVNNLSNILTGNVSGEVEDYSFNKKNKKNVLWVEKKVSERKKMQALIEKNGTENVIYAFRKKHFDDNYSVWLRELPEVQYVIISPTTPMSIMKRILIKLRISKDFKERERNINVDRCLSNLNIASIKSVK